MESLQEDPERYGTLVDLGLVDPEALTRMSEEGDLTALFGELKAMSKATAETPSLLSELDLRSLDVLAEPDAVFKPRDIQTSGLQQTDRTVVFSDIEGFTGYTRKQGDIEASALLKDHYDVVSDITRSRGGDVVKRLGDGHMLSFREPAAAVCASLELAGEGAGGLRLRVGAHHGLVVVMTGDLFGDVVNVAARVTDLAAGGETMVTVAVRDAAGPIRGTVFDAPRSVSVDGLDDPVSVCLVHV